MTDPLVTLERISMRLDRAVFHLHALERETDAFLAPENYSCETAQNPETGQGIIRMEVPGKPPPTLALIASDCIHNLRCTLDNLVWAIAKAQRCNLSRNIAFPIHDKDQSEDKDFEQNWHRVVGMLSSNVQDAIRGLQPCRSPKPQRDTHPLYILNELSNRDKHHQLNLVNTLAQDTVSIECPSGQVVDREEPYQLAEALVSIRFRVDPPDAKAEGRLKRATDVIFDDVPPAPGQPVDTTLETIYRYIAGDVLAALRPHLP